MSGTTTPSPAAGFSTAEFSNQERVDLRRFCGYPAYGLGASGFQSWRFFQAYGTLEYRLTNFAPEEFQQGRLYLSQLYPLEQAVLAVSTSLDTAKAAVWTRNPQQLVETQALYDGWRRRLCDFIGIPPGPALGQQGTARISV